MCWWLRPQLAQTGLFVDVVPLNPHGYRPNEFFANDWVYEGLVKWGSGGQVKKRVGPRSWWSAVCCR